MLALSSRGAFCAATLAASVACTSPPEQVVKEVYQAIETAELPKIRKHLDPKFTDPLGTQQQLLEDLEGIFRTYPKRSIKLTELHEAQKGSKLEVQVTGMLTAEFIAEPTWRVQGPIQVDLVRTDGFRIRSGILSEFRDIQRLAAARREALEANAVEDLRPLLHPGYKDGDLDADQVLERLKRSFQGVKLRLEVSNYRLELRGPLAHLDEHYVLKVNGVPSPPLVGRFTLKRSAGRWRIAAGLTSQGSASRP